MLRAERTRRAKRTPDLSVAGSIQTSHEGGDPYMLVNFFKVLSKAVLAIAAIIHTGGVVW